MGEPVTVAVPATSANLGPGFDALGLALQLEDLVTARVVAAGVRVQVSGEGAGQVPDTEDHLIIATMLRTFQALGVPRPPGLELTCRNRIPHARGLGSSSAAIVAGILLAQELAIDLPREPATDPAQVKADQPARELAHERPGMDDAGVLRLASELEGHPDNVAACLLGGLTIAWTDETGARAVRLAPAPEITPGVFIAPSPGLTATARARLPAMVPHADATFNAAHSALLVHALTTAPELLLAATEDRLHQPYRVEVMPETAQLVGRLRAAGVPAVVSGAGPSVLALTGVGDVPIPAGWCFRSLSVAGRGARIVDSRHAEGDPVAAGLPS